MLIGIANGPDEAIANDLLQLNEIFALNYVTRIRIQNDDEEEVVVVDGQDTTCSDKPLGKPLNGITK